MSLMSWLADRLVLSPSTGPVSTDKNRQRVEIPVGDGWVEAWVGSRYATPPDVVVLKFPGTAGRAERASDHPAEFWDDETVEVWAINHKGYGGSSPGASLKFFADSASCVVEFVGATFPETRVVVTGNSLGCISALFVSARFQVAGVMLRNPPPIAQLIRERRKYNWWNFAMAGRVADEIPGVLDAVANAGRSTAPCVFVQSELDRLVPVEFQIRIRNAYAGENRSIKLAGADHHDLIPDSQRSEYDELVSWLVEKTRG